MNQSVFILLALLNLSSCLEVLFPAGGNTWDLDRVDSYRIVWKHAIADPTHLHVAIHDGSGKVVHVGERVRTDTDGLLVSGLSEINSGSNYRIVLLDSSTSDHRLVARSGKFSIRQTDDSASSAIIQEPQPTSTIVDSSLTVALSPASSAGTPSATTPVDSPIFTEPTFTSNTPQPTVQSVKTSSKSSQSLSRSTRTSTTAQTSTAFPKYTIPNNKGLSAGAKAGIGVGIAIVILTILGACFLFFIRRKRRHQNALRHESGTNFGAGLASDDNKPADAGFHGKPELVGDAAYVFGHNPGSGYAAKPELETRTSLVESSRSGAPNEGVLSAGDGIAELPHPANGSADHSRAELHGNPLSEVTGQQSTVAELASTLPAIRSNEASIHHGQVGPMARSKVLSSESQRQNQDAVELPSSNKNDDESGSRSTCPASVAQSGSDQETVLAATQSASASSTLNAPIQRFVKSGETFGSTQANPDQSPDVLELEALRQRQRDIAASIAAAEELARLRREQQEVQQMIQRAETRQAKGG